MKTIVKLNTHDKLSIGVEGDSEKLTFETASGKPILVEIEHNPNITDCPDVEVVNDAGDKVRVIHTVGECFDDDPILPGE